jgi:Domain of unknown function (DUF4292)
MQKLVKIVFVILVVTSACKSVKKVQIIETQIFKKDTAQTVVISEAPKVDSAAIVKDIMNKLVKRKIDFTSFNAKINVDYETADNTQKMTAYVSLKKDSALFVKIAVSPYGVVENIYVNKDSVILIRTKGEKSIQYSAISYLQESTNIPFDFSTLQDILVGNPIFLDSNIVSYKSNSTQLLVYLVGNLFKNLVTLDNTDYKVMHSKLDDVDDKRNRTCDITLSNYVPINGHQFATYRTISVSEKSKLDISLDFKQYDFNNPLQYRFAIPTNYKPKKPIEKKPVAKKTASKK